MGQMPRKYVKGWKSMLKAEKVWESLLEVERSWLKVEKVERVLLCEKVCFKLRR